MRNIYLPEWICHLHWDVSQYFSSHCPVCRLLENCRSQTITSPLSGIFVSRSIFGVTLPSPETSTDQWMKRTQLRSQTVKGQKRKGLISPLCAAATVGMSAFTQGARGEWGPWPLTCCLQEARPRTDTSPADRHMDTVLLLMFRTSVESLSEAVGDYGIAGCLYKRELLQLSASPFVSSHSRRLITSTEAILLKGSEFSYRRYLDAVWKHQREFRLKTRGL